MYPLVKSTFFIFVVPICDTNTEENFLARNMERWKNDVQNRNQEKVGEANRTKKFEHRNKKREGEREIRQRSLRFSMPRYYDKLVRKVQVSYTGGSLLKQMNSLIRHRQSLKEIKTE
ncbi:hypothetical protein AB6A40_010529 [Gnathostoma spinigerum]|uniref:Uncharacterized protein n=1 Tax=Gnathostoma spinigerum TaxID=75299 RepID=A0ABD6F3F6_9BILA